jgi:Domain of unknown function (DUF4190)
MVGGRRKAVDMTDVAVPPSPSQPAVLPPPMVVAQPKTSGLAIASLVLGILWIYGLGSVLAIIFAAVAKQNIKQSNGWVTGGGMATAGLVLGIIGAAVLVLIIIGAASSP